MISNLGATWIQKRKPNNYLTRVSAVATKKEKAMTSSASESAFEQKTYDATVKKLFTRITECPPTRRSVEKLRKEVEHILVNI